MKNLQVKILRGEEKIGENLIEVFDEKTTILLDCGVALNGTEETETQEKKVVGTEYDAIIISHYHHDHSALLKMPLKAKEIYLGKGAYKILKYCQGICEANKEKLRFLEDGNPFFVGAIECMPYLCDHSAYDSYMVGLKKGGERVLYTGDFRSNGRKSFEKLLQKLPRRIDRLIVEGTLPVKKNLTEKYVEDKVVELCQKYDRVFVLQSTLNVDRTVSFYRASKRANRCFIMSVSSADICRKLSNIPNPVDYEDCFTYLQSAVGPCRYAEVKGPYGKKLLGRKQIAKRSKYVMQVNARMLPYLQEMAKEGGLKNSLLIFSMWGGYKEEMGDFFDGLRKLGVGMAELHVSGHADLDAVKRVIERTNPDDVSFVHTNKDDAFLWESLLLSMGIGRVNDSYVERNTKTSWTQTRSAFLALEEKGYIEYDKGYHFSFLLQEENN